LLFSLLATLIVYFFDAIFHYSRLTISKSNEAPLKLSDAEEHFTCSERVQKSQEAMSTPLFLYQSHPFIK